MKIVLMIGAAALLSACGARVLEVKTDRGGFCFLCVDKPDNNTMHKILTNGKGDK